MYHPYSTPSASPGGAASASKLLGIPLISANEFTIDLNRRYIVKGLLLGRQVSMICGAPNLGKSSVLASICAHVAMGRDVGPHRVRRAFVVYVAAEDHNGILERAYPFMQTDPATTAPFDVMPQAVDLTNSKNIGRLAAELEQMRDARGLEDMLVVFDTLNLCIGEGDENSARDMGRVIGNAQFIAKKTGAHVVIVHHTNAHDDGRPRGSTALKGNLDTLLVLHKADDTQPAGVVFLTQEKQRSIPRGRPTAFQIMAYHAGLDNEGDPFTVPYAVPFAPKSSLVPASARPKAQKGSPASDRASDVLRVMRELEAARPGQAHGAREIGAATGVPFNDVRDNADSLRVAVNRALDALLKDGKIISPTKGAFRLAPPDREEPATSATVH